MLYGIGVVLTGILAVQRRFVWSAAAPLVWSLVVVAATWASDRSTITGALTADGAGPATVPPN